MAHDANTPTQTEGAANASALFTIGNLAVFHWALYWLMNGLDKFVNRTDLGIFTWYGKDRAEQFGGYFDKAAVPESLLHPLLYLTGIVEFLVFIPMALVLQQVVLRGVVSRRLFETGFFWSAAIFTGFSFFDVIFGDRAELWEHGTFLIGVLICYKLAKDEFETKGRFV
ncbi:MAG: hypothetical protein AAF871_02170 [Pseudomonadota bacterium]